MPKIEIAFSALNMRPNLSRSASASGNYASSNRTKSKEDMKIDEGILLVNKELEDGRIFKYWTCKEYGHFYI